MSAGSWYLFMLVVMLAILALLGALEHRFGDRD